MTSTPPLSDLESPIADAALMTAVTADRLEVIFIRPVQDHFGMQANTRHFTPQNVERALFMVYQTQWMITEAQTIYLVTLEAPAHRGGNADT